MSEAINVILVFKKKMCDPSCQPKTYTLEEMVDQYAKEKNVSLEAVTVLLKRGVKALGNRFVNLHATIDWCVSIYVFISCTLW